MDDIAMTKELYRLNRTIVSEDIALILDRISQGLGLPIEIHRYASGRDIGTWIVPLAWNVNEAWVKQADGEIVASYDEHPLFLAPYSLPFKGSVSKQELEKHIRFHPKRSHDYYYEYRYAYDFSKRLTDWVITMPRARFDALEDGMFEVCIDVDTPNGEMLIGDITLPGKTDKVIALLVDYCHPGQVNDSWSGILAMMNVMRQLMQRTERTYTYKLLLFPETIGSCVHLEANPDLIENCELAIFSEFVGWGRNWSILAGERKNGHAQTLANLAKDYDPDFKVTGLYEGFGNDEIIFDYVGVPSMSVQMTECDEYHSSSDHVDLLEPANIEKAAQMIINIIDICERNRTYRFKTRVPVYMTRFNIYNDSVFENAKFSQNRHILNGINDGLDLITLSEKHKIPFEDVSDFVERLLANDLIEVA